MQQIGRYQIRGELGRGAMGLVYEALDPSIGRTVAIKTIRLSEFTDPTEQTRLRERLFREARSAGALSHPNIVTIYDVGEQGDTAYIAMQCVNGPTLDTLLAEHAPSRDLILRIIRQTAEALDYAHSKGVIHRDIKPANIMVHEGHTALITDFGVARLQSQQMTQAGTMLGTPNYMSPEQIKGIPVTGAADQFSLGVIAYELLTGERPFAGDSMPTVIFKIMNDAALPPRRLNPSLAWPVDAVMEKVLAKDPEQRYASCSDFATALENACKSSGEWHPMPTGAAAALPTVIENAQQEAESAAAPEAPVMVPANIPEAVEIEEEEEPTPSVLRAARKAAMFVVVAGILFFGWWSYKTYFGDRAAETAESPVPATPNSSTPPGASPPRASNAPPAINQVPSREDSDKPAPVPERRPQAQDTTEPRRSEKPKESAAALPKTVHLVTVPPGAAVSLDNGTTCTTPCDLAVTGPRHVANITLDGYRKAVKIIEPVKDPEPFLSLEKTTGTLAVRSNPVGASITLNGQSRSERTPAMMKLTPGHYRLEVTLEGRKDTEEVDVKDSVISNVDVDFSK